METLAPWDAVRNFASGWSLAEAVWVLVAVGSVFLFYNIASRRKQKSEPNWKKVLFWIIAFLGWAFTLYMVAWKKMSVNGYFPVYMMLLSATLIIVTTYLLTKKTKLWEKIVSGTIMALIGYGILASFGTGAEPLGYGLLMGFLLGLIVGLVIATIRDMHQQLNDELDPLVRIEKEKAEAEAQFKPKKSWRI